MKVRLLALAAFGLLVATAWGDQPKSYRVELSSAIIGTEQLAGGDYRIVVHQEGADPKVHLTEVKTGKEFDVAAKIEAGGQKFGRTEVHTQEKNGARQITEIRIGGTNLTLSFP